MGILGNSKRLIKQYLEAFEAGKLKKPDRCAKCGRCGKLVCHAKYSREVILLCGIYRIPIKRIFCRLCKHTFAMIPVFIEKYHRYGKEIIELALKEFKRYKAEIEKISDILADLMVSADRYMETSTLYRWKKKFQPV